MSNHDCDNPRDCTECILRRRRENGKVDDEGVVHSDNGAGWCVGHVEGPGDGRCTVLVRHCPVLNTPEQVAENRYQDAQAETFTALEKLRKARVELGKAEAEFTTALDKKRALRTRR